jgi:hypothetical protein
MNPPSQPDPLCACAHHKSEHEPASNGDTRCLVSQHPADLIHVFDDGRDHPEHAYCACLRFTTTH